ncbi:MULTISPECIES: hypothetical protein [unclassified Bacteroides]|uniref:hypothetical protein n=1 Tax=unclassified Bacteroides TaxID=2646097 RepID=UPI0040631D67
MLLSLNEYPVCRPAIASSALSDISESGVPGLLKSPLFPFITAWPDGLPVKGKIKPKV